MTLMFSASVKLSTSNSSERISGARVGVAKPANEAAREGSGRSVSVRIVGCCAGRRGRRIGLSGDGTSENYILNGDKRAMNCNISQSTHLRHGIVVEHGLGPAISLLSVVFGSKAACNAAILIGERACRRCTASARGCRSLAGNRPSEDDQLPAHRRDRAQATYLQSSISASTTRSRLAARAARESLGIGAWRSGEEPLRR